MDLDNGDTVYVEATVYRTVRLTVVNPAFGATGATLTPDEARTMANALLAAATEAESQTITPVTGAM